jgi:hypothetical protein
MLVALGLGLEAFTRVVLFKMSKDLYRFNGYAAAADKLLARPGLKVALVGNSATQAAVDLPVLEKSLTRALHREVDVDMFVADASCIETWLFMMNHYFYAASRRPDAYVVLYFGDNLKDGARTDVGRLAFYFTSRDDWKEVFDLVLHSWSDRVEFAVASKSAMVAARDRIRDRLISWVVPDYKDFIYAENQINYDHESAGRPKAKGAYRVLERFLARSREHDARLIFVAFPTRANYDLEPEEQRILGAAGVPVVDLRSVAGIKPDDYADWVHMKESAAPAFTSRLADALTTTLRQNPEPLPGSERR